MRLAFPHRHQFIPWQLVLLLPLLWLVACSGGSDEGDDGGDEEAASEQQGLEQGEQGVVSQQQPGSQQGTPAQGQAPIDQPSADGGSDDANGTTTGNSSGSGDTGSGTDGDDDDDPPPPPPPPPDTTPPEVTGLANAGALATAHTWNWSCNESCSYRYVINTSATDTPSGAFGTDTMASISTGDGLHYIHVQAQDAAGNISDVATASVDLDNTAPSFGGAIDITAWDGTENRSRTAIWAAATDSAAGVAGYDVAIGVDDGDDICVVADDLNPATLNWIPVPSAADFAGAGYQVVDQALDNDGATISLSLLPATDYCLFVRATDTLGNAATLASAEWQLPFSPHHLASLVLWLDSSDSSTLFQDNSCTTAVTAEDDVVGCWQDKSDSDAHMTHNFDGQPVFKDGAGEPRVDFSGGARYLDGPAVITGTEARTLMMLTKLNSLSTSSPRNAAVSLAPNDTSGTGYGLFVEAVGASTGLAMRVSGNKVMDYTPSTTEPVFLSVQNVADDDVLNTTFFADGDPVTTQVAASGATLDTNGAGVLLGGFGTSGVVQPATTSYDLDGDLFEVLVFNESLDPTDRERVEGYIACKWNRQATLPMGHPFETNCP